MTNPIKKAVDSLFLKLGIKGNYQGKEVSFLLFAPDEVVGVGFVNAHLPTTMIKIRTKDAPHLSVGDEITTDEMTLRITAEPKRDLHRLIWEAEVLCNPDI